ncbi:monocarboxylate transporter 10-like isoform X1 [Argiope bruennichi]|uniref:monocarboxylate transporter 10-like isoform X1 n=1 Tax=Argiope bruennichi TaxID=94029 RepID=UPI002494A45C|nr:monocarboxylate transporter 10-like isoform X1 [Argiope bruennichi]
MGKTGVKSSPTRPDQLLGSAEENSLKLEPSRNRAFTPPDGGWGWVVCLASFWTNGTIFGVMNCFGVLYVKLKDKFAETHEEAAFVTSWVGSVSIGMTFLLSPVASILTDRLGIRTTCFIGGLMATIGMLLSSFVTSLELLYLTYGVLLGSGASLAYTPSLVVLGHYFHRRLGFVNGLVTAGSSVFTMIMPLLLSHLLDTIELSATLQLLSLMMASLMLCAVTFRPLIVQHQRISEQAEHSSEESLPKDSCLDLTIWRNRKYLLWVFAIPTALFGYFVPYVHLVQHVKDILPSANGEILVTCIGLTSGVGRIIFGKLADFPFINRIMLQQVAFLSIGILTMVLVVARHFVLLVIVCLFLGLFDGCFISLLGPIAFDVVGQKGASQAIGFLLGFCSIPLTVGPPVAGLLYDHMKNYNVAFLLAGVPPIVGSLLLCLIHRIRQAPEESLDEEKAKDEHKKSVPDLIQSNGNMLAEIDFLFTDIVIKTQEKMALKSSTTDEIKDREHSDETTHLNPAPQNAI